MRTEGPEIYHHDCRDGLCEVLACTACGQTFNFQEANAIYDSGVCPECGGEDGFRLEEIDHQIEDHVRAAAECGDDVAAGIWGLTPSSTVSIYIRQLSDATEEEKEALLEIYDAEGFGGMEWDTTISGRELAARKLVWLRDQRKEGLR